MTTPEQLPKDFCDGYWEAVVEELYERGIERSIAERAVAQYREFMEPAGWTVYNDAVEESARMIEVKLKRGESRSPTDKNGDDCGTNGIAKKKKTRTH